MHSKFRLPENIDFTFETERLIIRPIQEEDRELYTSLYTDAKTMRLIAKPFTLEQANKAFNATIKAMQRSIEHLEGSTMTWVIIDKSDITGVGIQSADFRQTEIISGELYTKTELGEVELGIMLTKQSHGRKIPVEAISGLAGYCLDQLKVKSVYCTFNKSNLAVTKFIKRVGFVNDPLIKLVDDKREFQLLPSNWHAA